MATTYIKSHENRSNCPNLHQIYSHAKKPQTCHAICWANNCCQKKPMTPTHRNNTHTTIETLHDSNAAALDAHAQYGFALLTYTTQNNAGKGFGILHDQIGARPTDNIDGGKVG